VNTDTREGKVVPTAYKTPAVLYIYIITSGKKKNKKNLR